MKNVETTIEGTIMMNHRDHEWTDELRAEMRQQAADFWSCNPDELRGARFGDVLAAADVDGAHVFWALWTDADLDQTL